MMINNIKKRDGFTLIELLVAVTMTAFVIASVYATFIAQQRSFTSQDQVSETRMSSKIAFDMLVKAIRDAGFGYPEVLRPNINNFNSSFTVTDSGSNGGPDSVTLVGGYKRVATLASPTTVGLNQISIDYVDGAELNTNDKRYISIDGIGYAEIIECTPDASGNCSGSYPITLDRNLNNSYPAGRPIYLLEDFSFCVTNGDLRRLRRGGNPATCSEGADSEVILENIEDLQFAYAVDRDNDGIIDDCNNNGAFDSDDFLNPNGPFTPKCPSFSNSKIMAVRVGMVTRTMYEDPNLEPATKPYYNTGITLENNKTQDNDRFRRTIWQMVVMVRNPREL